MKLYRTLAHSTPTSLRHPLCALLFAAISLQAAEPPSIQIISDRKSTALHFTGLLQSAPDVSGPWLDLPNASSPWPISTDQSALFFRTRDPAFPSIFASSEVLNLTLIAPFQTNFNLAFAGTPDGIFPPKRVKATFEGTATFQQSPIPITLRVRGNSSLQECPFPKLTLKVSPKNRIDTPLYDAREIKIGTHCAEGGYGNIGRLREERATFREALAYESLKLFGFIAPRIRRAHINYVDISPTNAPVFGGWNLTRNAMIMDDIEVVGERLGGRALDDDELASLSDADFSEQLIADLKMFHALIGNWDYALSTTGRGLWNTDLIELANKSLIPVIGDFDLASWVTGKTRPLAPNDYLPDLPNIDRNVRFALENLLREVGPEVFGAGRARFEDLKSQLQDLIQSSIVDDEGKTNALQHLESFYNALILVDNRRA